MPAKNIIFFLDMKISKIQQYTMPIDINLPQGKLIVLHDYNDHISLFREKKRFNGPYASNPIANFEGFEGISKYHQILQKNPNNYFTEKRIVFADVKSKIINFTKIEYVNIIFTNTTLFYHSKIPKLKIVNGDVILS